MSIVVINKLPQFGRSVNMVMNDAMREGARDILVLSKNKAPFLTGGLRADNDAKMVNFGMLWRVSYWKEYARFQEFGGDSTRKVRNYTTGGTGKGYLKSSGDQVAERMNTIYKKHGGRA